MKRLNLLISILFLAVALPVFAQKTYVVSVGLGKYQGDWCEPLSCAHGDARCIAKLFDNARECDVFMLLSENATRDHILRVLKSKAAKATPKDEIIFMYTGHGFDGGISAYNKGEFIYCKEIQDILKSSRAGRKVMFLGSCHSGSFTRNYGSNNSYGGYSSAADSNVLLYVGSRASEYSQYYVGNTNSFFINRLHQGLSGSADKNGDMKITARELFNYVNKWVVSDSNGEQHPQMYGRFDDDMVIVNLN